MLLLVHVLAVCILVYLAHRWGYGRGLLHGYSAGYYVAKVEDDPANQLVNAQREAARQGRQ